MASEVHGRQAAFRGHSRVVFDAGGTIDRSAPFLGETACGRHGVVSPHWLREGKVRRTAVQVRSGIE
jgi:hypothetical protein